MEKIQTKLTPNMRRWGNSYAIDAYLQINNCFCNSFTFWRGACSFIVRMDICVAVILWIVIESFGFDMQQYASLIFIVVPCLLHRTQINNTKQSKIHVRFRYFPIDFCVHIARYAYALAVLSRAVFVREYHSFVMLVMLAATQCCSCQ